MSTPLNSAVVAVFDDPNNARQAIARLLEAGFRDDQIGLAARHLTAEDTAKIRNLAHTPSQEDETAAVDGAITGIAAGAGLGAICGLAILTGMLPPIGPAIAGGVLTVVLSSAAAGAAAVGIAGALAGLGVSHHEAEFYENEFKAGRVVVAVTAPERREEAQAILREFGGYDVNGAQSQEESPPNFTSVAMPMEPGLAPVMNDDGQEIDPPPKHKTIEVPVSTPLHAEPPVLPQRNL